MAGRLGQMGLQLYLRDQKPSGELQGVVEDGGEDRLSPACHAPGWALSHVTARTASFLPARAGSLVRWDSGSTPELRNSVSTRFRPRPGLTLHPPSVVGAEPPGALPRLPAPDLPPGYFPVLVLPVPKPRELDRREKGDGAK